MAIKNVVLGRQTTNSTGSELTLINAPAGFQNFSNVLAVNDTCVYGLFDGNGIDWEFGVGELISVSPDIFARAITPIASSNADNPIVLSANTHTLKSVALPDMLVPNNDGNIDCNGATLINAALNSADVIAGITFKPADADSTTTWVRLNPNYGNYYAVTITDDYDIMHSVATATGTEFFVVDITQDAVGGHVVNFDIGWTPINANQYIDLAPNATTRIIAIAGQYATYRYNVNDSHVFSEDHVIDFGYIHGYKRCLIHPSSDTTARIITIASNAASAYPIGHKVDIYNQGGAGNVSIEIIDDTLSWLPSGTTGTRTLAANGMATITKIAASEWVITGVNLT